MANTSPPPPSRWATLTVASANVLNLAQPGRHFYDGQDPYSQNEFERKVEWLGERFRVLNADVLAVQEVWDEVALRAAIARSGLQYGTVAVPGAENGPGQHGAQGTPRVGLVTRLKVESLQSIADFPAAAVVQVPGLGPHTRFERPPLLATLRMKHGQEIGVITAHLKSKRPKFLQDASGKTLEDTEDPTVQALGSLRSLLMRAGEALALRLKVVELLHRTRLPLIVMGDFNDGPHSVTTQLIAATSQVAYDKGARDNALFSAWDVQGEAALRRDVAYSHIHQGYPEVLDQVLVSEEFVATSRAAIGDVRRVEVFNDHLHEGRDRSRSDHGFVRALLRLKLPDVPV
ncbi:MULTISPECIES: endonuclease/exonuclease/phosphatase family protein [Hydrogenophaga]|uniref:Endonuclease/Exonuclease/phosphatase family protein n=1 Tax=Hydrogenophaga pseudoflava TaxID=47421 RepID=A0A4P6WZC8_HYDPS|nr:MULTISPECIES: endonuclease/exonuclease/phosphatase family protein [Hydrogenophaga]QBM27686.1 Endonuclease/Exonuclease/phosphatase family protein [Hydrogenophaga pseudoflava]